MRRFIKPSHCFGGWSEQTARQIAAGQNCRAGKDGDCKWDNCPQNRDKEPMENSRHCPLDTEVEDIDPDIIYFEFEAADPTKDVRPFNPIQPAPIPFRLFCEVCGIQHIDEPPWDKKHHHTHACQHCGAVWRPAIVDTVGVKFLPGFKND